MQQRAQGQPVAPRPTPHRTATAATDTAATAAAAAAAALKAQIHAWVASRSVAAPREDTLLAVAVCIFRNPADCCRPRWFRSPLRRRRRRPLRGPAHEPCRRHGGLLAAASGGRRRLQQVQPEPPDVRHHRQLIRRTARHVGWLEQTRHPNQIRRLEACAEALLCRSHERGRAMVDQGGLMEVHQRTQRAPIAKRLRPRAGRRPNAHSGVARCAVAHPIQQLLTAGGGEWRARCGTRRALRAAELIKLDQLKRQPEHQVDLAFV